MTTVTVCRSKGGTAMPKFSLGSLAMTRTVNDTVAHNKQFAMEITAALHRYALEDWGDMCEGDKQLNDNAVKTGNDRIVAAYNTEQGKIYIITEWDRSTTLILFADEY